MMLSKKNSEALENFSEKLEVEGRSLWQDARRRFMHNRAAVTSLIMLVLIALFVTFAPMEVSSSSTTSPTNSSSSTSRMWVPLAMVG